MSEIYCSKLFESLDRRLEERKTLDEIGRELCDTVDDPRGKTIRLIKAHKGEQWLYDNADWLGYNTRKINNPEGAGCPKNFCQITTILNDNRGLTTKEQGIKIEGRLAEAYVFHVCIIEPYIDEGYHFVTVFSHIPNENVDEDRMIMNYTKRAFCDDMINEVVDTLFYPDEWVERAKKFILGELNEFPATPKYQKSTSPDWEWEYCLSQRYAENHYWKLLYGDDKVSRSK